jgi:cytochrome b561
MRLWRLSIVALVFGIAIMGFARTTADPDLWGHLRFGLDLLETGRVIRPDPYSYLTAGVTWVNHEWLAEALMAVAWRAAAAFGAPATGLVLLKLAMVVATVATMYWHLLWRGLSAIAAGTIVLAYLPVLLPWLGAVRPQMFTYVCFALTLAAIARAEEGQPRMLWVLPAVFALWANLHGGFLAGGGICALWLTARAVRRVFSRDGARRDWRDEARCIWLPVIVAGIATLLTPYAGDLWLFLRTALTPRLEIAEWNPIVATSPEGVFYVILLAPTILGWIYSRREKRPVLLFLYLIAVLLPLIARRHSPLFALALVILAGEHMADAASRLFARRDSARLAPPSPFAPPAWMSITFLVMAFACLGLTTPYLRQVIVDRESFPVEAVRTIAASGVRTNMATEFAWGEYVLWHLGPGVKVSTDGRRETVYSDAAYEETLQFMYGYDKWDAVLDHAGVDLALVPTTTWPTFNLMRLKSGWTLIYQDDRSALFGRDGSVTSERVRATHASNPPARAADEMSFP